ncbi:Nodulation protein NolG [Durusdinium trenchii]|uniref:Nodulation protein NolG n=1 Tax=Durusdinium trenchii TaxID=1381693 RepID=A0ABP0HCF3_9DINO
MRYRTTVLTCVILLVVFGTVRFFTMPRREDPEFTIMTCVVTTSWPGASAMKVEELITDPIEEVLDGIEEVDVLRSTSTNGQSTIYVDLDDSLSPSLVDNVWDKVRARVAQVEMPEPGITPNVQDDFGDTSVIVFSVSQVPLPGAEAIDPQHEYTHRELDVYSDRVRDALRLLPGVAKVERHGVRQEAIYIETDIGSWSVLGLTSSQLSDLASARNIIAPGGIIDTDEGRFYVKPGGELDAVREIDSIVAAAVSSGEMKNQVYLKDLGLTVRRDYEDPPELIARAGDATSSRPAVMVALTMKSGANIIDICEAAKQRVHELQTVEKAIPPDIRVLPISDQSEGVHARVTEVIVNVVEAILIVVVVVYLVVGFRTAAVMAANIPFVVLISIGLITFFDVQLEQISLASIVIALGLLVDNAVQVCDQSRTNQLQGMGPEEASIEGARVLASPMLSGTLTTIAAFLPMLYAIEGGSGEFIYSLPVTLSVTLAVSWLLAMTLCVILAAKFIRVPQDASRPTAPLPRLWRWIQRIRRRGTAESSEAAGDGLYGLLAKFTLRFKFLTVGGACGVLILVMNLPVGSEFFPQNQRDQFAIEVWLPENASIRQTDEAARQVEEMLRKLSPTTSDGGETVERLRAMRTLVGGGGSRWYLSWEPEPRKANFAEILVRTTDGRYTSAFAQEVRRVARHGDPDLGIEPVAGARVVPIELMLGPPAAPVVVRVMGNGFADPTTLHAAADRVQQMIRSQPETWNVHDSWGADSYELRVAVDEDRANLAGVTNSQVARTLNSYYSGLRLTTFREGDHQVPVYFRLRPEGRRSLSEIDSAFVEGNTGKVPLDAIADVRWDWEPAVIERRDLNRVIEVRARVEPGASGNDVVNRVMTSEEMQQLQADLPAGFWVEVGGALEESLEAGQMMLTSFVISFVMIVVLLVIQYDSVAKSMIIIATLPLAMIGALLGLWMTNNPLGFMPQLGLLSLFGIVLNTGIIFIEFADLLIAQKAAASDGTGPIAGLSRAEFRQCLVDAGKQRLLPIFLTTATTVGGLIPLAVAGGPLWVGMAWLMIYGLLVATLLTLFVVPALYAILVETFGLSPVKQQAPPTPATDGSNEYASASPVPAV